MSWSTLYNTNDKNRTYKVYKIIMDKVNFQISIWNFLELIIVI
jgi:hypothetical protein